MHPSLTDEAQAEKKREYDRYERAQPERISKHSQHTKRNDRERNRRREKNRRAACKRGWKR